MHFKSSLCPATCGPVFVIVGWSRAYLTHKFTPSAALSDQGSMTWRRHGHISFAKQTLLDVFFMLDICTHSNGWPWWFSPGGVWVPMRLWREKKALQRWPHGLSQLPQGKGHRAVTTFYLYRAVQLSISLCILHSFDRHSAREVTRK